MELFGRRFFENNALSGVVMIIIAEIIFGIGTVMLDIVQKTFPIALMLGLRGLFAGIALSIITHRYWSKLQISDVIGLIVSSWLGLSFMQFIFSYGISLTNAMVASVVLALQPIVLYFFSVGYLKEKFNPRILVGSVVSLCGVLLIVFDKQVGGGGQSTIGGFILLASLFLDCFGVVTKKRLMKRLGALQIVSLNFLFGSIPLLFYAWLNNEFLALPKVSMQSWLAFSYLLFVSGILAFAMYYFALKRVSVERTSVYNYLMPVVGVVASIFILGTEPDAKFALGAVLVSSGLIISQIKLPHTTHLIHKHRH